MCAISSSYYNYYAERMFWAHCLQHIVLHHDGPFFIALSAPGMALMAGLPTPWRNSITSWIAYPPIQHIAVFFNRPVIAVTLFCALNIFWMVPSIHFLAMLDWRLNRIMSWSMAINGLMFWCLMLNSTRLSPSKRIGMMLAIIPPQIILGLLIFVARKPIYMAYGLCGRIMPDLPPLLDQQIGGFILWVPAVMMSVIGVLILIRREWLLAAVPSPAYPLTA